MKNVCSFLLSLILINVPLLAQSKITPRLAEAIARSFAEGSTIHAVIVLEDQYPISVLDAQLSAEKASLEERAYTVITQLQQHARRTQGDIVRYLQAKSPQEVPGYRQFWISNLITLEATADVLMEVGNRNDIAYIDLEDEAGLIEPLDKQPASRLFPGRAEPNLKLVNAHKLWQEGITGQGIIVMNIDTGVEGSHPALNWNWRGNLVPWQHAWHDPFQGTTFPTDIGGGSFDGHGTGTMGVMAGLDPLKGDTVGVAFDVQWIAARFQPGTSAQTQILSGMQWALNPDGNPTTIDDMPTVVNNSWDATQNPCATTYDGTILAMEAAGIAVIWAAGNSGPGASTIISPATQNHTEMIVFSVGGVRWDEQQGFQVHNISSRGPTPCNNGTGNQIKPEITAPLSIRSCYLNGEYAYLRGTSFAAPHAAGAIALLKQAFPNKTGTELKWMLYGSALDQGAPGEDNDYGMGVLDIYNAYLYQPSPEDPRRPMTVAAYSDFTTPASASLTWTDPALLLGGGLLNNFEIQVWRDGQFISAVTSGIGNYTDTGLTDGVLYEYQLRTRDLATDSLSVPVAVSVYAGGSPFPAPPGNLVCAYNGGSVTLSWSDPTTQSDGTPIDDLGKIYIYREDVLIDSVLAGVETYTDTPDTGFTVHYFLRAVDNEIPPNLSEPGKRVPCFLGGTPDILVWEGAPLNSYPYINSGDSLFEALAANGQKVFLTDDLFEFGADLSIYDAIFAVLGVFPFNHFLTENGPEALALENYLANGGRLYIEGGYAFGPGVQGFPPSHNIRPWFGLGTGNAGSSDVLGITGMNGLADFSFVYLGINNLMNELNPVSSTVIWQNSQNSDVCGVWYAGFGSGRAIGVVPSFGGLVDDPAELMKPEYQARMKAVAEAISRWDGQEPLFLKNEKPAKFIKKFAYQPEPKLKQNQQTELLKFAANQVNNRANTKVELMAGYLQYFDIPVGGIEDENKIIPLEMILEQNYPNPFNPGTTIKFALPKPGFTTLKVYNILGEEVSTIVSENLSAGNYQYNWDAHDQASGVYFYRLEINGFTHTKKMLLLR